MDLEFKDKLLIREAVSQERDCLVVSWSIVREVSEVAPEGILLVHM